MTEHETYNGWTNYETWATALWIDNDRGTYTHARGLAQDARNAGPQPVYPGSTITREPVNVLAQQLEEWVEEHTPDLTAEFREAGMFQDLLTHALGRVNWREIAASLLEDCDR